MRENRTTAVEDDEIVMTRFISLSVNYVDIGPACHYTSDTKMLILAPLPPPQSRDHKMSHFISLRLLLTSIIRQAVAYREISTTLKAWYER